MSKYLDLFQNKNNETKQLGDYVDKLSLCQKINMLMHLVVNITELFVKMCWKEDSLITLSCNECFWFAITLLMNSTRKRIIYMWSILL